MMRKSRESDLEFKALNQEKICGSPDKGGLLKGMDDGV